MIGSHGIELGLQGYSEFNTRKIHSWLMEFTWVKSQWVMSVVGKVQVEAACVVNACVGTVWVMNVNWPV